MNPLNSNNLQPAQRLLEDNTAMSNLAETIRFARSFSSPQAFMQELQRQNPQGARQLQMLAQTLQNPMRYAMQQLSNHGINPQELFRLVNGR